MITCKTDLREYMEADRFSLGRYSRIPNHHDIVYEYEIALIKCEYYANISEGYLIQRAYCFGEYGREDWESSVIHRLASIVSEKDL